MTRRSGARDVAPDATMLLGLASTWARRRGAAGVEPLDLLLGAAEVDVQTSSDLVGDVLGRSGSEFRDALLERLDQPIRRHERSVHEPIPLGSTVLQMVEYALATGSGPVVGAELLRLALWADAHPSAKWSPPVEPARTGLRLSMTPAERRVMESPAANAIATCLYLCLIFAYRLGHLGGSSRVLSVAPVAWLVLAMPVALVVAVALHEAGHVVAGWLTRGRIAAVHLGAGRELGVVRMGRCRVVLHLFPGEGRVVVVHPIWPGRARMMAVYLSGIAVNVLTVLVLVRWHPPEPHVVIAPGVSLPAGFPMAVAAREALLIGSIAVAVMSLLPVRPRGSRLGTDGWNALRLLRGDPSASGSLDTPAVTLADGSMLLGDRMAQALRGSDGTISAASRVAVAALYERRWADAASAARGALESATEVAEQAILSNIVADCLLLSDRRTHAAEAIALSTWAVEHSEPGPIREMCQCTLALALVMVGRFDEAEGLLPAASSMSAEGYAAVRLTEAMIAHTRGDVDGARSTFDTVSRRFPDSELVDVASAELGDRCA